MTAKEIRAKARASLKGHWTPMVLISLVYMAFSIGCILTAAFVVGDLLLIILMPPVYLGLSLCSMRVVRNEGVVVKDLWRGTAMMGKSIALYWINSIYIALWSVLLYIPGIIKSYEYSMSMYVLADNRRMTTDEAREESIRLMDGNKMRLFRLKLSFLGWIALNIVTLGIATPWTSAYYRVAEAHFYEMVKAERPRPVYTPIEETQEPKPNKDSLFRDMD